jgi:hypothetical protein
MSAHLIRWIHIQQENFYFSHAVKVWPRSGQANQGCRGLVLRETEGLGS